ncbi:AraC family transcriptional regulator [Rhizobium daejeonense]|uniref:AraC family transcriptional regulator n=1 Tax=Rhizobium daejeonense TaxID=240521 RepID=A0A6M1S4T0_9HYPH|nr:AraC family transcriptional regulator [Rhizobium daejeonense]NGO65933.1 AraC family transcriptional regulator [Rhizobium daejeonense]
MTMSSKDCVRQIGSLRTLDTATLSVSRQIPLWEAHTRDNIIGIRCTSVNCSPLVAVQRTVAIGATLLTEMRVSAHVVERGEFEIAEDPRDLVLVFLILEGEAMLGQGGRWVTAYAGDIVALRSDRPFIVTYPRPMRQIVLSLPEKEFASMCGRHVEGIEYLPGSELGNGGFHWFARQGLEWLSEQSRSPSGEIGDVGVGVIAELFARNPDSRKERVPAYFLAAEAWIADHLSERDLTAKRVAEALCISVRHLNRLFEKENTTVRQSIHTQRLQLARQMLQDPARTRLSIGEIAFQCGFSVQSIFNRQFRKKFGVAPSTIRARPLPAAHGV